MPKAWTLYCPVLVFEHVTCAVKWVRGLLVRYCVLSKHFQALVHLCQEGVRLAQGGLEQAHHDFLCYQGVGAQPALQGERGPRVQAGSLKGPYSPGIPARPRACFQA